MSNELIETLKRCSGVRVCAWELDDGIPSGDDPASNIRWHTVALEGEWDGHYGGSFKVAKEHLEQMVANFEALKNDAVVDYEHASLNPFVGKAPAAGWIDAMQVREAEAGLQLAARIKWTPAAAAHIRDSEYRYLSPVIAFRTPDRKSGQDLGASISSVALTNSPFLDELPEVTLNSHTWLRDITGEAPEQTEEAMNEEQRKALALELGLADTASPEDIAKAVKDVAADAHALTQVAQVLGIDEGAAGPELVAAAQAVHDQVAASATINADELQQLRADAAQVRELTADARLRDAGGKITAANRAFARKIALKSQAEWDEYAGSLAEQVPTTEVKPPAGSSRRNLSALGPNKPTDEQIQRLCAVAEIQEEAEGARIGVESYVRANFAELAEQHAA